MNLDQIQNHALRLRVKTLLECLDSEGRQRPKIHGNPEPLELWWSKFSISFYDDSPVLHLQSRQGITTIREKGNLIPLAMHPKQDMYWVQEALRLAPKVPPTPSVPIAGEPILYVNGVPVRPSREGVPIGTQGQLLRATSDGFTWKVETFTPPHTTLAEKFNANSNIIAKSLGDVRKTFAEQVFSGLVIPDRKY